MDAQARTALSFRSVSKSYAGVSALSALDLDVEEGTVHALIGENGAGKSTCLGIASGRISPTSGSVEVFGRSAPLGQPRKLRRAGVAAIYQELTIAPNLTTSQNVFLGQFRSRRGVLDRRAMRARYEELARDMGVPILPEVPAGLLSVAEQQTLEILRALVSRARVILLDEPTASLALPEREALMVLINRLRADAVTVVFVSHSLDEVLEISDRITVFKDGQKVVTIDRGEASKQDLVAHMLGTGRSAQLMENALEGGAHDRRERGAVRGDEVLDVVDVTLPGLVHSVSLHVRSGEILGIGGLVGSGRTELLRCLSGLEPTSRGRMRVEGRDVSWPRTVRAARRAGIVLIPEDRKGQGIVPGLTAAENIGLGRLRSVSSGWVVRRRRLRAGTATIAARFGFSASRLATPARELSGGNQQKLLLARAYASRPRVLLADEPTRGIDVGAKAEIMDSLREMAGQGCAVVVVSSEQEVVVAISDRVIVLHEGRTAAELDGSAHPISESTILQAAFALDATDRKVDR